MLVRDLCLTITTLVFGLCPQSQVVIDHKSLATMHYLLYTIPTLETIPTKNDSNKK